MNINEKKISISLFRLSIVIFLLLPFLIRGLLVARTLNNFPDANTTTTNTLTIRKISGDAQFQQINTILKKPLIVRVLSDDKNPVPAVRILFSVVSSPPYSKNFTFDPLIAISDSNGYASSRAILGSKPGKYIISARIEKGTASESEIFFTIYCQRKNWLLFVIFGLVGGLTMFLYGIDIMSSGLKKSAGTKMRFVLKKLTQNKLLGVVVGAFVTIVIQSSSATTVMLVSFVQAQLMTFGQTLGVILGADIGTTVTAQLIAFKLTDFALLFIAIGFLLRYLAKDSRLVNMGSSIMGFGMLFYGMYVMSETMAPLQNYSPFISTLASMQNPLLGVLVGTIFTALFQSSAATVGIVLALAQKDLVTLTAAIPLLFGANIGTCITALLASINTNREAKRVAMAHVFFKIGGVLVFILWIPTFAAFISTLSDSLPRQIANAHTVFNVALTILFFPFTSFIAKFLLRLLPDVKVPAEEFPFRIKYLKKDMISTHALALTLAKKETLRMGNKVKKMVAEIITPFINHKPNLTQDINQYEMEIDFLQEKIIDYLTKISRQGVNEDRLNEIFQMSHAVTEFEIISDIVTKNVLPLAVEKQKSSVEFSEAGKKEIISYHLKSVKQLSRALEVLETVDLERAERMRQKYKKYRLMEVNSRRTHFARLAKRLPETVASNDIHLDLMDYLKQINSHATSIARVILDIGRPQQSTIKK